jgi:hypothetical protein
VIISRLSRLDKIMTLNRNKYALKITEKIAVSNVVLKAKVCLMKEFQAD